MISKKQRMTTEERIADIKRVWEDGMSCAQIAEKVSWSATRNSIIGMFQRHKVKLFPCVLNPAGVNGSASLTTNRKDGVQTREALRRKEARIRERNRIKRMTEKLMEGVKVLEDKPPIKIRPPANGADQATGTLEDAAEDALLATKLDDALDTPENFLCVAVVDHVEGQCRWPSEGNGPITYCGCETYMHGVYCERHHRRGVEPSKPRRKDKRVYR